MTPDNNNNNNKNHQIIINNPYMPKCDHMVQQRSFGSTVINFTVYFWVLLVSNCHCLRVGSRRQWILMFYTSFESS